MSVDTTVTFSDPYNIKSRIHAGTIDSFEKFKLNLQAYNLKRNERIDKLISVDFLKSKIDAHPYQLKVALDILKNKNTTAILADEVGLGKTIEAGIILKEHILRGTANKILILVPKALLNQWQTEMKEKFSENFIIARGSGFKGFDKHDKIVCSIGRLVHQFDEISKINWDFVIVDEAHLFSNFNRRRTSIANLNKRYMLLLTATPIQNKITDVYSLIDLLQPGMLGTRKHFVSKFSGDPKHRSLNESMEPEFQEVIRNTMCRTRRTETGIPFTKRFVESRQIQGTPEEYELTDNVINYLKDYYERNEDKNNIRKNASLLFSAVSIQQSLSSSPEALIIALENWIVKKPLEKGAVEPIINMAKKIHSSKEKLLIEVLTDLKDQQAVIFCSRRSTAKKIQKILSEKIGPAIVYSGEISSTHIRKNIIKDFLDGKYRFLVATDAAAEGLNLQKCHILFNYDLHWNPMKIEQRIGRVHRFGQQRDVTIFNLTLKDSIDDYVLNILFQKIKLFSMAVGNIETIVSELKSNNQDLRKTIMEIVLRSNSKMDIQAELEKLRTDMAYLLEKQKLAQEFTEGVFG